MDGAIAGVTLKFRVCKLSVVERNFCVPKSTTFPLDSTWEAEPRHRLTVGNGKGLGRSGNAGNALSPCS